MMRDTWRAVLVLAVVMAVRHDAALWSGFLRAIEQPAAPSGETIAVTQPAPQPWAAAMPVAPVVPQVTMQPVYGNQPAWQAVEQGQHGPLRQVGSATVDLAEALIGVVRR